MADGTLLTTTTVRDKRVTEAASGEPPQVLPRSEGLGLGLPGLDDLGLGLEDGCAAWEIDSSGLLSSHP